MLNVLHVCTDFWPTTGGIQSFVLELAKRSRANGINASVLCCDRAKGHEGYLARSDAVEGIPITRAPFVDMRFYKPTSFSNVALRNYDLVHVHGVGAQLDYLAVSKRSHARPIVVSTHGAIFHTNSLRWLKQQYFYRLQPFILKRVELVAACSHGDEELFRRIAGNNVQLVENAVDVDELLSLPTENKSGRRCLYVGRLAPNKGIGALLKVFAFAKRRGANFELRMAGPDSSMQRSTYESLVRQLSLEGHVRFLGTVEHRQLMAEYERCDIFVSASQYEGFGLSAIEARAAGCRLLLQRNTAFMKLFDRDDAAVTLIDYELEDVAGIKLADLLEEKKDGSIGRQSMRRYSWSEKIHEWLAIYRRVSGIGAGPA